MLVGTTGFWEGVDPYDRSHHINEPKHFVYIQHGCGMQSEASCSLNHDITTSLGLRSTQKKHKIRPPPAQACQCKGKLIWPFTLFQASSKTLWIHPIWMWGPLMPTVASQPWHYNITQAQIYPPPKKKRNPHLHRPNSVRVDPYDHSHHIKVC